MNGAEVLRIVDAIHRDKNIDKGLVFEGIEQAILSAARKHYGDENELSIDIDRESGEPTVTLNGQALNSEDLGDVLGRISAQTAKQVMIQKIREAERDALHDEYSQMRGQIVSGAITRVEGGSCTVNLGKVEGILPRGEQIPGESHRTNERVRAVVLDVKKAGSRVKIILSRTHPDFVRRLFELEVPEVSEHIIEVRSLAREAGYRSKVAVSCIDSKIDCVGACVGVRGSRIKNIVNELAGERIDIVRWNDSLQVLVPNGLQPAEVEDVILCPMLGRVLVLVREDQLPLAIGKMGQNVRLASKLVGWDIEVMTREELDEQLDKSVEAFASIEGINEELAESLVSQGFFSYYDLSCIEPDQLAELGGLTDEQCDSIIEQADAESDRQEEDEARRRQDEYAARRAQKAQEAEEAAAAREASANQADEPAADEPANEAESAETADNVSAETESEKATTTSQAEEPEATEPGDSADIASETDAEAGEDTAPPPEGVEQAEQASAESGEPVGGAGNNDESAENAGTASEGEDNSLSKAKASATDD